MEGEKMQKEHGQVTGIIWKTPEEMAAYQELQQYAKNHGMTVSAAAKQLLMQTLRRHVN